MDTSLCSVQDLGEVAIVQFNPRESYHTADSDPILDAWATFDEIRLQTKRIIIFRTPKGFFSPNLIDDFWRRAKEAPIDSAPIGGTARPNMVGVADAAVLRAFNYLKSLTSTWTIFACEGEVDFDFLGLLLACNFRICGADTTFTNNSLRRNTGPGCAAPWFLVRLLGYATARRLYHDEVSLDATEALELGIVDQVSKPGSLDEDALVSAEHYRQFDPIALSATVRAFQMADLDFHTYINQVGTGYERVPS